MSLEDVSGLCSGVLADLATPSALRAPPSDFLDVLPLAIYACDADGRILWFNQRATELWGRTPKVGHDNEKFSGSHKLYFSGRLISRDETPMANVLRTGVAVRGLEGKVERPDGSTILAVVHIEPIEDDTGMVVGAINCFHETTALHHSVDELEDFFENGAVGLHLVSRNGTIVRANKAELQMLGYTADEYVGKNIAEFHADKPTIDDILKRLLRHEEINQYPARLRAKDGSIKHVLITSNARVRAGEFLNTRCFTIDVTKQKLMEEALERRMTEQTALHEFAYCLERATSLLDVYDCAMVAIIQALDCQRASILLFDQTGSMRFVASRGLSEKYKNAVDGHSPWQRDTKDPQPILISDIEAADLPDALKQTVKDEGVCALSFIPLQQDGRLLGKFMVYYDRTHEFSDAEIRLAQTIARQLSFSIDRMRGAESAQRLVSIVENSDDAIISKNLDRNHSDLEWRSNAAFWLYS